MENMQNNYEELKKISEKTEKFIKLANKIEMDDKEVPKTEKGMSTKARELIEKLNKRLESPEDEKESRKNKKSLKRKSKKY
jgi:hypothetical protein